jgi:hypothetical protein
MSGRGFNTYVPWTTRRTLIVAAALLVASTLAPRPTLAQPLPVTRLAYSAKYICGSFTNPFSPFPAPGYTNTMVELHNPHSSAVVCSVKVVEDFPLAAITIPQYAVTIDANGTLYLDCDAIAPGGAPLRMGFVEIIAPRQVKVVAVYREVSQGRSGSVAIGKKTCPWIADGGFVRHSATVQYGSTVTPEGDVLRNDTIVSIVNLASVLVNVNIKIMSETGMVTSFPKFLQPNGFTKVTQADLPPATPLPFIGSVNVEYPGSNGLLEVEEILKEYTGGSSPAVSLSVVEVQPVTLR